MESTFRHLRASVGTSGMSHATTVRTQAGGSVMPSLPEQVFAYGFSLNKRRHLRKFAAESTVRFVGNPRHVPPGATLLLWGSRPAPQILAPDVSLVRVEDGFLRSVGLGAALVQPLSWVIDRRGIHYDANRPSDLEHL